MKYAHGGGPLGVGCDVADAPGAAQGQDGPALEKAGQGEEAIEEDGRAVEVSPDEPAEQRAARRLAQLRTQKVRAPPRNLGRRVERWSTLS